ncbi:ATP-binding protein [Streptomyces sp. ACA25]|uniref:ATP-binding protein n=1 Tax=Streptomyces sp. ACA25 TaxID=3022596 RepID=UPI002307F960|nr:ATP-binding protein [Streptomyces sp. ACA25]MDB1089674.1 ATP-binding protein [Streptomyces sp. ACA25]
MSTDGTQDTPQARADGPAGPPARAVPPAPRTPPAGGAGASLTSWLHTPRPQAEPGIWRPGHAPKPPEPESPLNDRELHGGALLALLAGLLVWSLCWNGYLRFWLWPLEWITFDSWSGTRFHVTVTYAYYVLFAGLLAYVFGRVGNWPQVWRRWRPSVLRVLCGRTDIAPLEPGQARRAGAALVAGALAWGLSFGGVWLFWLEPLNAVVPDSWWREGDTTAYVVAYNVHYLLWTVLLALVSGLLGNWLAVGRRYGPALLRRSPDSTGGSSPADPGRWSELRAAGAGAAADRLAEEVRSGTMSDLDYARIDRAWREVRARPTALERFADAVLADGAAAFAHPSGDRDLTVRAARHDLLTRQVHIGRALDDERNPYEHRGEELALDPDVLGTSLLAVGPPGSGKTGRIVRPVTETMCLQALTGQAAVVAVGPPSSSLAPDDAFDVIIRVGDPDAVHRLDLYGGAEGTDEAAGLVAEALIGGSAADPRAAAAVLAQLIGPYRAAYGHFPGVPELRALLDGAPAFLATLREDLGHAGAWDQERELAARARQAQRPDDLGPQLADRLALLDRAGFSAPPARSARRTRPFSLSGALEHPLRVRVDLPGGGHTEAGRILTRLLLAQFTGAVTTRPDRSLFACLVLDDATAALTPESVRGLTHLRPANAGAVLALRTLDDLPEPLRTGLLGAVGCRVAFSGITTWDAEHFARAWGKDWTEDRDVTSTADRSGGALRRSVRGVRKLFTGRDTTTETVTVRRVERERWSASELAHRIPPRHAVISLTTVAGEAGPPVLVRLGG